MYGKNVIVHKEFFKHSETVFESCKLRTIIRKHAQWHAKFIKSLLKSVNYDIFGIGKTCYFYWVPRTVIKDSQWIAIMIIGSQKFSLKICLPHIIAILFLKAFKRLSLERFFFRDEIVFVKNISDCFWRRNILKAFIFKKQFNFIITPPWIIQTNWYN